jgi:hypothetical protein
MIVVVAERLLAKVAWGLKLRVFTGAFLSLIDTSSDISVVFLYLQREDTVKYAALLLVMIGTSLLLQLLICYVQNGKNKRKMLTEMALVLCFMKPAVDARRIALGQEKEDYQLFDYYTEAVSTKIIETFAESIPGCILQVYVLVVLVERLSVGIGGAGDSAALKQAIFSIASSLACSGFVSGTISFDYDVDPGRRKETPKFYGYVPDHPLRRTLIFICMIANGAGLLFVRCLSSALLMRIDVRWLFCYLIGDLGFYLTLKKVRGEFYYWLPIDAPKQRFFVSVLARTSIKIVTDYTGVVQFRHPNELGGAYWTFNLVMAFLVSFASVGLYYTYGEFHGNYVWWWIVCASLVLWVLFFGFFVAMMEKDYRPSLWSVETAPQFAMAYFLVNDDDRTRAQVATIQRLYWKEIEKEVKEYFLANWSRWEREMPEWFVESYIDTLPDDCLPPAVLEMRKRRNASETGGKGRRRSSAAIAVAKLGAGTQLASRRGAAGVMGAKKPEERRRSGAVMQRRGSGAVMQKRGSEAFPQRRGSGVAFVDPLLKSEGAGEEGSRMKLTLDSRAGGFKVKYAGGSKGAIDSSEKMRHVENAKTVPPLTVDVNADDNEDIDLRAFSASVVVEGVDINDFEIERHHREHNHVVKQRHANRVMDGPRMGASGPRMSASGPRMSAREPRTSLHNGSNSSSKGRLSAIVPVSR